MRKVEPAPCLFTKGRIITRFQVDSFSLFAKQEHSIEDEKRKLDKLAPLRAPEQTKAILGLGAQLAFTGLSVDAANLIDKKI